MQIRLSIKRSCHYSCIGKQDHLVMVVSRCALFNFDFFFTQLLHLRVLIAISVLFNKCFRWMRLIWISSLRKTRWFYYKKKLHFIFYFFSLVFGFVTRKSIRLVSFSISVHFFSFTRYLAFNKLFMTLILVNYDQFDVCNIFSTS